MHKNRRLTPTVRPDYAAQRIEWVRMALDQIEAHGLITPPLWADFDTRTRQMFAAYAPAPWGCHSSGEICRSSVEG